jgi:hypothetical protein
VVADRATVCTSGEVPVGPVLLLKEVGMGSSEKVLELLELLAIRDEAKLAFSGMITDSANERRSSGGLMGGELSVAMEKALDSYIAKITVIWEEHFSEQQIDELIAFFRTTVGTMFVCKKNRMEPVMQDIAMKEARKFLKAIGA